MTGILFQQLKLDHSTVVPSGFLLVVEVGPDLWSSLLSSFWWFLAAS